MIFSRIFDYQLNIIGNELEYAKSASIKVKKMAESPILGPWLGQLIISKYDQKKMSDYADRDLPLHRIPLHRIVN